jgi:hypothetical protein
VPARPKGTLYSFGAPMLELLPLVPLFARHSVGIAIFSYDGGIVIGCNADRDTVPDLEVLTTGIETSFAELKHLALAEAATRRWSRRFVARSRRRCRSRSLAPGTT